jgi:hypothetical protein
MHKPPYASALVTPQQRKPSGHIGQVLASLHQLPNKTRASSRAIFRNDITDMLKIGFCFVSDNDDHSPRSSAMR